MPFHIDTEPEGYYWQDDNTPERRGPFRAADAARRHRHRTVWRQTRAYADTGAYPTLSFFASFEDDDRPHDPRTNVFSFSTEHDADAQAETVFTAARRKRA